MSPSPHARSHQPHQSKSRAIRSFITHPTVLLTILFIFPTLVVGLRGCGDDPRHCIRVRHMRLRPPIFDGPDILTSNHPILPTSVTVASSSLFGSVTSDSSPSALSHSMQIRLGVIVVIGLTLLLVTCMCLCTSVRVKRTIPKSVNLQPYE